jgi:hypothetical protein
MYLKNVRFFLIHGVWVTKGVMPVFISALEGRLLFVIVCLYMAMAISRGVF